MSESTSQHPSDTAVCMNISKLNKHVLLGLDMHLHLAVGSQPSNLLQSFARSIRNVMHFNCVCFSVLTDAQGKREVSKGLEAASHFLMPQRQQLCSNTVFTGGSHTDTRHAWP